MYCVYIVTGTQVVSLVGFVHFDRSHNGLVRQLERPGQNNMRYDYKLNTDINNFANFSSSVNRHISVNLELHTKMRDSMK